VQVSVTINRREQTRVASQSEGRLRSDSSALPSSFCWPVANTYFFFQEYHEGNKHIKAVWLQTLDCKRIAREIIIPTLRDS